MWSIGVLRVAGMASLVLLGQPVSGAMEPAQTIRQVATLQAARAAHTAATLPSGQVLVVGGMTEGGGSLASVELFDPARNTVQELGSLVERRAGHTATLLEGGSVLIAGGYNGEYLASVEIFDASAQTFRQGPSLRLARSGHTATLLADGRVLFVGGVGKGWSFLRSAELYDPRTGQNELVDSMTVPRESHTATLLADSRVLIIGGHRNRRPNMEVHASAELFDPRTRRFEAAGKLTIARHKHDAIRLADGRVLVIGGADHTDRLHYATTEIYNASDRTFERGPSMAQRRYKIAGTSVLLRNGNVLVTSGASVAELLIVERQEFRTVSGRFPAAYRFAAAAMLRNGDVFIAGGYSDGNENTAGIWRFNQP